MNIDLLVLTKVINNWDPVGLLEGGAPEDEYSIEIRKIVAQCSLCKSEQTSETHLYSIQRQNECKTKSSCLFKSGI